MGTGAGGTALALSGGGARAAYQAGALAGIAERLGDRVRFPIVTGVSAGAINAAGIAAAPGGFAAGARALEERWNGMTSASVYRPGVLSLGGGALRWLAALLTRQSAVESRGLLDTHPLRRLLEGSIDPEGVARNREAGRLRALALTATGYADGRTVTFVDGESDLDPWRRAGRAARPTRIGVDHVLASSALPLLFPAVRVEDQWYGDGSLRQLAPLAPAIHLGARRILAISMRHRRAPLPPAVDEDPATYPPPARILGMLLGAVFLDALDADAERLERVNRTLAAWPRGEAPHPEGLRHVDLFVLRPSEDLGGMAAGLDGCLPASLRLLVRALGTRRVRSQDLTSYLLFEPPYVRRLIELGRADVDAQWDRLEPFLLRADGAAESG